jgi:tetratricopeptide (TPR) repeat protein
MYLDRDYRPRRRRRGFFGRFWPLLLLAALAVVLFETRPSWLVPRAAVPTPTPTLSTVTFLADAESALARGDYGAALAAYARMAELDPANPEPLIQQARLHMIELDPAGAFEAASRALDLDEKNPAALTALARAEDWLNQYESALNHALDALELASDNVETLAVLAEIYADVGNYAIATEYIDQALALDADDVLALRNNGYLLEKQGKYQDAIASLDRALAKAPQRSDLYLEKARIYRVGLNDYTQALTAYRAAVDADATPLTLDAFGEGLYNAGDHLQAVRILRQALELDPDYPPALVHLGMALYARRNYEDAAASLDRGLPGFPQAREEHFYTAGLAHVYKEPRECDLAEPWLRKALEKNTASEPALVGLRICGGDAPAAEDGDTQP